MARQRSTTVENMTISSNNDNKNNDSGIEMKRPIPPPLIPTTPAAVNNSQPTSAPALPNPGNGNGSENILESWLRQPHLWPFSYPAAPMGGYQFVKDPLTGQMFFVPGFSPPSMWPQSPAPAQPQSTFGLTPFQQSLMQLQQESLLVRQAGLFFNSQNQHQVASASMTSLTSRPASPLRPSAPPPPSIESPDIKDITNEDLAQNEEEEDNLSVGDINDELKPDIPKVASEAVDLSKPDLEGVKVKEESSENTNSNGLHLLAEGIDRLESSGEKIDGHKEAVEGNSEAVWPRKRPSKLGLLCDAAFLSDDEVHLKKSTGYTNSDLDKESVKMRSRSLDSPAKRVKGERTLSSDYRSPKAERNAKAFIASKSLKVSDDLLEQAIALNEPTDFQSPKSEQSPHQCHQQGEVKMDQWERKMRLDIASIQKKYKEKYRELYKLQHKKGPSSNGVNGNSPHKKHSHQNSGAKGQNNHVTAKKTLAPISPWLQTFKLKNNEKNQEKMPAPIDEKKAAVVSSPEVESVKTLKNGSISAQGPDLSTITSKFRSARPNPFENLLKLSCVGKKTNEGLKKTEEIEVLPDEETSLNAQKFIEHATSTPKIVNKAPQKEAFLLKDDLSPLPKLHLAKNNNLTSTRNDQNVEDDADVSENEDDFEDQPPVLEPMLEPKTNITVKIKRPASPLIEKPPKKSRKDKKAKKSKKDRHRDREHHRKHKKPVVLVNDDSMMEDCIDLTNSRTGNNLKAEATKVIFKEVRPRSRTDLDKSMTHYQGECDLYKVLF